MGTLRQIVKFWAVEEEMLPFWMRPSKGEDDAKRSKWSMDDTFFYLIGLLNCVLVGLAVYSLFAPSPPAPTPWPASLAGGISAVVVTVIYLRFLHWTYCRLFDETKHLRSEG
jgi:hypothetical protein